METGSVECTDEMMKDTADDEFGGLGAVEEDMPDLRARIKVCFGRSGARPPDSNLRPT
jgi:hypothetical protein